MLSVGSSIFEASASSPSPRRSLTRGAARPLAAPGLLLAALGGCQDYQFDQKCLQSVTEATVTEANVSTTPVDILFVVDNSGSMADEQENLVRNFQSFISVIANSQQDYRIAVVSTDVGGNQVNLDGNEAGGVGGFLVDSTDPYRPVDVSDPSSCQELSLKHACFRPAGGQPWIDGSGSSEAIEAAFGEAARTGTCGSGRERGSRAMIEALERTRAGGCNAGFLRDEANLVVIFVSDEDDDDQIGLSTLLTRLGAIKPLDKVRMALIGGIVNGQPSTCGTASDGSAVAACGSLCQMPRPDAIVGATCSNFYEACSPFVECVPWEGEGRCVNISHLYFENTGSGFGCDSCSSYNVDDCCAADIGATAYFNLLTAVEAEAARLDPQLGADSCQAGGSGRSACLVDSICQSEFASTLESIARDLVVGTSITLDPPASYPAGVIVRIVGGRYADSPRVLEQGVDYTVSDDGASIELNGVDRRPEEGEQLEVKFTTESTLDIPAVGACAEE